MAERPASEIIPPFAQDPTDVSEHADRVGRLLVVPDDFHVVPQLYKLALPPPDI